jgi:DNA-binding NtrC family response regulator
MEHEKNGQGTDESKRTALEMLLETLGAEWPTLKCLETRYMEHILAQTQGNKAQTARILGIDRRTVNRRLRR